MKVTDEMAMVALEVLREPLDHGYLTMAHLKSAISAAIKVSTKKSSNSAKKRWENIPVDERRKHMARARAGIHKNVIDDA